jgi:hypothetical protein
MAWEDVTALVRFRELHFLPRVIFSLGAVLLIGALFVKAFLIGFLGVGLIFGGSALNLCVNTSLAYGQHRRDCKPGFPYAPFGQCLLAVVLTILTLSLLYYFYRHGEMPTFLRPLPGSPSLS